MSETTTTVDLPDDVSSLFDWDVAELTMADRCDHCDSDKGSQAFVKYGHVTNRNFLDFCGHHSRRHHDHLLAQGFVVVEDARHKINEKPSESSAATGTSDED